LTSQSPSLRWRNPIRPRAPVPPPNHQSQAETCERATPTNATPVPITSRPHHTPQCRQPPHSPSFSVGQTNQIPSSLQPKPCSVLVGVQLDTPSHIPTHTFPYTPLLASSSSQISRCCACARIHGHTTPHTLQRDSVAVAVAPSTGRRLCIAWSLVSPSPPVPSWSQ
jgi:hypothetical protein